MDAVYLDNFVANFELADYVHQAAGHHVLDYGAQLSFGRLLMLMLVQVLVLLVQLLLMQLLLVQLVLLLVLAIARRTRPDCAKRGNQGRRRRPQRIEGIVVEMETRRAMIIVMQRVRAIRCSAVALMNLVLGVMVVLLVVLLLLQLVVVLEMLVLEFERRGYGGPIATQLEAAYRRPVNVQVLSRDRDVPDQVLVIL